MKEIVSLAHGSGGSLTRQLIEDVFLKNYGNEKLNQLQDSSLLQINQNSLAFTTDSFVVKPYFFPNTDIGHLSICGTINDLSVSFAQPLAISASFIIEEGFPLEDLKRIANSMKQTLEFAAVQLITGDTKVVSAGEADKIFITTSGIGIVSEHLKNNTPLQPGDSIILNGNIGDHGIAVLSAREELPINSPIISDSTPLNRLIFPLLQTFPRTVKFMRDVTRGGLATVLNEVVNRNTGIEIFEEEIPVSRPVGSICELLGMDPLYLANEGKAIFIVKEEIAEKFLALMKKGGLGKNGAIIGRITDSNPGRVVLRTRIGGKRIIAPLVSDQLPRIC
ncbi:MAG: hydrogenase expression/formation protein HypE [Vulcanimicrobiota bacterium]